MLSAVLPVLGSLLLAATAYGIVQFLYNWSRIFHIPSSLALPLGE